MSDERFIGFLGKLNSGRKLQEKASAASSHDQSLALIQQIVDSIIAEDIQSNAAHPCLNAAPTAAAVAADYDECRGVTDSSHKFGSFNLIFPQ